MTTIEHSGSDAIGRIPIGRRIAELLQERGDAYSIRAFSERIGINRETFRLTLTGDRPITLSILEKVAEQLGISEERLRQMDTFKKEEELVSLLQSNNRTKVMMLRARTLAFELVEVAMGDTERGYAYNNMGRAQFLLQQYEEAHKSWKMAYTFAQKISKSFDDSRLLKIVAANFMMACARLRDYSGANEMLQFVEEISTDNPRVLGVVAYSRMVMYGDRGDLDQAKKFAYQSLEHFSKANDPKQIGHGHINAARTEYLLGNYAASAEMLSKALEIVFHIDHILVRVVKDYVRSLMKLRDYKTAAQIVEKYESNTKKFPEYWNKIQIMQSVLKDDPTYEDNIANDLQASTEARALACQCLFEYYANRGDSHSALRYYELKRKNLRDNSEFIDKEAF